MTERSDVPTQADIRRVVRGALQGAEGLSKNVRLEVEEPRITLTFFEGETPASNAEEMERRMVEAFGY